MAAPTRRWLSLGSQAGCCGTLNRSKQRSSSDVGPYFASSIGTCIGAFGHRCFACLRGKLMLSEAPPHTSSTFPGAGWPGLQHGSDSTWTSAAGTCEEGTSFASPEILVKAVHEAGCSGAVQAQQTGQARSALSGWGPADVVTSRFHAREVLRQLAWTPTQEDMPTASP